MNVQREIDKMLSERRAEIETLGALAVIDFGDGGKAQMAALERVGLTARTFTETMAFVKRQAGKQREWQGDFCRRLLSFLRAMEADALDRAGSHEALVRDDWPSKLGGAALRFVASEYVYQLVQRPAPVANSGH